MLCSRVQRMHTKTSFIVGCSHPPHTSTYFMIVVAVVLCLWSPRSLPLQRATRIQQRCFRRTNHRAGKRHEAAAIRTSTSLDGGHNGEGTDGKKGGTSARWRDHPLSIHARPGSGQHRLPGEVTRGKTVWESCDLEVWLPIPTSTPDGIRFVSKALLTLTSRASGLSRMRSEDSRDILYCI